MALLGHLMFKIWPSLMVLVVHLFDTVMIFSLGNVSLFAIRIWIALLSMFRNARPSELR